MDHKAITGFDTPEEYAAYEKGRSDEQLVTTNWVQKWDGSTNSVMGAIITDKSHELAKEFAEWMFGAVVCYVRGGLYHASQLVPAHNEKLFTADELFLFFLSEKHKRPNTAPTFKETFADLIDALDESRLQIEYLHGKFQETGSGNTVLSKLETILHKYKDHE